MFEQLKLSVISLHLFYFQRQKRKFVQELQKYDISHYNSKYKEKIHSRHKFL